jgi:hypothetical protein
MSPNDEKRLRWFFHDQAETLERCVAVFQEIQGKIPRPTPEDIEQVRKLARPMTRYEYVLARLQTVVVVLEDVASDLRIDLEYGFQPSPFDLIHPDINALVAATEEGESEERLLAKTVDFSQGCRQIAKNLEETCKKD